MTYSYQLIIDYFM